MNIASLTIERSVPIPPPRRERPEGACSYCHRIPRAGLATCDYHLEKVRQAAQQRKEKGICLWGSTCPNPIAKGHTMCRQHLDGMLAYSIERRNARKKAKVCIDCGNAPQWFGLRCIICRQRDTHDPLPPGARKALAKYRRKESIAARRNQAREVIAAVVAYRKDLMDHRAARVLAMRHGLADGVDRTLEEIGATLNVTRERIRQIEKKALDTIARKGIDVSLVRPPFGPIQRTPFSNRAHLVKAEQRKHAKCHALVAAAVRDGTLIKKSCEWLVRGQPCGDPKTVGHHEDYDKPLDVIWVCRHHHMVAHGRSKKGSR